MFHGKPNIWSHYTKTDNKLACNYCFKQYSKHATRQFHHLINCASCPVPLKKELILLHQAGNSSKPSDFINFIIPDQSAGDETILQSITCSSAVSNICTRGITSADKIKLDKLLAKAIITSGMPFSVIENKYWVNLFNNLRPAYKVPTAHQLSTILSEQEYEYVKREAEEKLLAPCLQDGWSNIRHELNDLGENNDVIEVKPEPEFEIQNTDLFTTDEPTEDSQSFNGSPCMQDPLGITTNDLEQSQSTASCNNMEDIGDHEEAVNSQIDEPEPHLLNISDTRSLKNTNSESPEIPMQPYDLFGKYISKYMQKLPLSIAIQLQMDIQTLVLNTRLKYIRDNNRGIPNIDKEQRLNDKLPFKTQSTPNTDIQPPDEPSLRKRRTSDHIEPNISELLNANPPPKKQLKSNCHAITQTDSKSVTNNDQLNQNEPTDFDIFGEHISAQLDALPKEIAHRLQSEILEMLKKYPHNSRYDSLEIKTVSINEIGGHNEIIK